MKCQNGPYKITSMLGLPKPLWIDEKKVKMKVKSDVKTFINMFFWILNSEKVLFRWIPGSSLEALASGGSKQHVYVSQMTIYKLQRFKVMHLKSSFFSSWAAAAASGIFRSVLLVYIFWRTNGWCDSFRCNAWQNLFKNPQDSQRKRSIVKSTAALWF